MKPLKDLFGIDRYLGKKGKPMDERSGLMSFFITAFDRPAKVVAIRLGHYSLSDLYYLKSDYLDRERKDKVAAIKWLWVITRTQKTNPQ